MTAAVRNRLVLLGAVWGLVLAVLPALVMTDPDALTGFLVVALACAAVSGVVGTLAAGRRAPGQKGTRGAAVLRDSVTGAVQGIVRGAFAALLFWVVMAVTVSGFTLWDLSVLMSPRIFLGSFFVALSAFVYTLVGGLLLGHLFGPLVERAINKEKRFVR